MAMAALRRGAWSLACQRPPAIFRAAVAEERRRLIHVGPPAGSRTFSPAEEQQRLSPRLIHGGRPAAGQTYSRPRRSNHRGKPKQITLHEKLKPFVELSELLKNVAVGFFKLSCFGFCGVLLWNDLSGPRHVPRIARALLLGPEPLEERPAGGGKESEADSQSS